jgi:hypothetical protein
VRAPFHLFLSSEEEEEEDLKKNTRNTRRMAGVTVTVTATDLGDVMVGHGHEKRYQLCGFFKVGIVSLQIGLQIGYGEEEEEEEEMHAEH